MYLSISSERCLPLQKAPKGKKFKTYSGQCAYCKIKAPSGLEIHKEGNEKKLACPLCHACLHIDKAATEMAGKIIWLPEIEQAQLNIICSTIFISLAQEAKEAKAKIENAEPTEASEEATADSKKLSIYDKMRSIYKAFEYRALPVESFFGTAPSEFFNPSDPAFFVQQIFVAKKRGDFSEEKLQGLRFLPKPGIFYPYIKNWSSLLEEMPVDTWSSMVIEKEDETEGASE